MLAEKLTKLQEEVKKNIMNGKFELIDPKVSRKSKPIMVFGTISVEGINYYMSLGEGNYLELRNNYDDTFVPLNFTNDEKSTICKLLWGVSSSVVKEMYDKDMEALQKVLKNIA